MDELADSERPPVGFSRSERTKGGFLSEVMRRANTALEEQSLCLLGRQYVEQALAQPAARFPVQGLGGRFASGRMGVSFDVSEGYLGWAAMQELEADDEALLFCELPPLLTIHFEKDGRNRAYLQSPTLLVVRPNKTVLITLEKEKSLETALRTQKGDARICRNEAGAWVFPVMARAASGLGLTHEVWTELRFNALEIKNRQLLQPHFHQHPKGGPDRYQAIHAEVERLRAPTFDEILGSENGDFTIDTIFGAIAAGRIFVDLKGIDLSRYSSARIFSDEHALAATLVAAEEIRDSPDWQRHTEAPIEQGDKIFFEGEIWEVDRKGVSGYLLKPVVGGKSCLLSADDLELYRKAKKIVPSRAVDTDRLDSARRVLLELNGARLRRALERLKSIKPHLDGLKKRPDRSLRRYIRNYNAFKASSGIGFLGLVDNLDKSGRAGSRLSPDVLDIAAEIKSKHYDVENGPSGSGAWKLLKNACLARGFLPPSESWFHKYLASKLQESKLAREGTKSAYQTQPRGIPSEAQQHVTVEPTRAWLRAHIDHTQIDLEARHSRNGKNLGRLWITLIIDHVTRRILGMFLSFEPPSGRSVAMALRDCVRRHHRLPKCIVVDGGKEFRSTWFETFCAIYEIDILHRPACEPRFGAQIERFFGTFNTSFLYFLAGNTQATKKVRQLTKAVNPSLNAVWSLPDLYPFVVEFLFDEYDSKMTHRGIQMTPREAGQMDLTLYGAPMGQSVPYDEVILFMTCPATRKGTAKVCYDGVKVNYFWFRSPGLHKHVGENLDVRFDPFDLTIAFAYYDGRWNQLKSNFARSLQGVTQRELELITIEYRKSQSDAVKKAINDSSLAVFISKVLEKEEFLLRRIQSQELQLILASEYQDTVFSRDISYLFDAANDNDAPPDAQESGKPTSFADAVAASKRPLAVKRYV